MILERKATCSCRALTLSAKGPPIKVSACHCNACKRRTGSSFGVGVFYLSEAVEIFGVTATYSRLGDSGHSVEFHFCPNCASTVYWLPEFRPGLIAIALGCIEDAKGLEPSQAVYDDDKHWWVTLDLGRS